MKIDYINKLHLSFDEPLEYRKVHLYPAKVEHYPVFNLAYDVLYVSRETEKDLNLMRLPYLEYLYQKSLKDEEYKEKWNTLEYILRIVFENQSFNFILKEDNRIYIRVGQRTNFYNLLEEEYKKLQKELLDMIINNISRLNNEYRIKEKEINKLEEKMFTYVFFNSEDFEDIKYLICVQNDIKVEHFNNATKKTLEKLKENLNSISNNNSLELEDLISFVAKDLELISTKEVKQMTIRRFNRYLNIIFNKDDYYLYRSAELNGTIKAGSITHWIKHYEPKGKYDDVLLKKSNLLSEIDG